MDARKLRKRSGYRRMLRVESLENRCMLSIMVDGAAKGDLPMEGVVDSPSFICDEPISDGGFDVIRVVVPDGAAEGDVYIPELSGIGKDFRDEYEIPVEYYDGTLLPEDSDATTDDEFVYNILTFFDDSGDTEAGELYFATDVLSEELPNTDEAPADDSVADGEEGELSETPMDDELVDPYIFIPVDDMPHDGAETGLDGKGSPETEFVDLESGPIIYTMMPQESGEETDREPSEVPEVPQVETGEPIDDSIDDGSDGKTPEVETPSTEDPVIVTFGDETADGGGTTDDNAPATDSGSEADDDSVEASKVPLPITAAALRRQLALSRRAAAAESRPVHYRTHNRPNRLPAAIVESAKETVAESPTAHDDAETGPQSTGQQDLGSLDTAFERIAKLSLKRQFRALRGR